ncbi:hypothetical protein CVT26_005987 [Gymnopilus dilepis]|uniref:Uncharacterized protein n=1 Tax=Gymnopilus dilepis TaxID=231916 RepID=A0A409WYX1_9AGAR|nr:hypothetical protein CVT26_005987 [Gymnopilus dilepis]
MAGNVDMNKIRSRLEEKLIVAKKELKAAQEIWFPMRKLKRAETDAAERDATRARWKLAKINVNRITDKLDGNLPFDPEGESGHAMQFSFVNTVIQIFDSMIPRSHLRTKEDFTLPHIFPSHTLGNP